MAHDPDQTLQSSPTPPEGDLDVAAEWEEAKRRRRMLEGQWRQDLEYTLRDEYQLERRKALGLPSTTLNLAKSTVNQISVIYDREAIVGAPGFADESATLRGVLDDAGLWQLAQSFAQKVIGMREAAYRLDLHEGDTGPFLQVQIVPRDLFHVIADPNTPDEPHTFYHYRIRTPDGEDARAMWTRDCVSIANPDAPVYRIESEDGAEDLSLVSFGGVVLGNMAGDSYPAQWRYASGRPLLPFVLVHAQRTGDLTNSFVGRELFDGALAYAALLQQWKRVVRDASWPQRVAVDAKLDGGSHVDGDGTGWVTTDEGSILMFRSTSPTTTAKFHQFQAGGDPKDLYAAIQSYGTDIVYAFDVSPADVARTHTDARSGHAIEISRDGQRAAQRRYEPSFRRGDLEVAAKVAAMWNRQTGSTLPETGWRVKYPGMPLSMQEKKLLLEDFKLRDELGATSLPVLVATLEGVTEDAARDRLRQFAADRAEFRPALDGAGMPALDEAVPAMAGVDKAQDTALNGAQVQAAQGIVTAVAAGQLPRRTGIEMLSSFFNLPLPTANRIMGTVGSSFRAEGE